MGQRYSMHGMDDLSQWFYEPEGSRIELKVYLFGVSFVVVIWFKK